jgi:hypothetical protein
MEAQVTRLVEKAWSKNIYHFKHDIYRKQTWLMSIIVTIRVI